MPYAQPGEAIAARLTSAVAGTASVGNVFPTLPTQDAPQTYTTYRRVSGGGATNFHGRSGLQAYTYRIDVYAPDEVTAEAVLTAIMDPDSGLPGWNDRPNGVQGVFPSDDADADVLDDGYATRAPGQSFVIYFQR